MLLLAGGCTSKFSPALERALTNQSGSVSVTLYYPKPENYILRQQSAAIIIDKKTLFYLKRGEQITFYLSPGTHEIGVRQAFSSYFTRQHTLSITMEAEHSYYVRTYPVFEGITYIPYWFIPLPAPDMRFRLYEVSEEAAKRLMVGKPVDPKERVLDQ